MIRAWVPLRQRLVRSCGRSTSAAGAVSGGAPFPCLFHDAYYSVSAGLAFGQGCDRSNAMRHSLALRTNVTDAKETTTYGSVISTETALQVVPSSSAVNEKKPPMASTSSPIRFYCCFTRYDLEALLRGEDDDGDTETGLGFDADLQDVEAIDQQARWHFHNTNQPIEFYDRHHHEWKPLESLNDTAGAVHEASATTIPLRCANVYEEFERDSDEPDDPRTAPHASHMEHTISFLVACLQSGGYRRASDTHLSRGVDYSDDALSTRDWVLHQAQTDVELRTLLLDVPHALEHICECLHFDFFWPSSMPHGRDDTNETTP